jgi:aryl-alcohol dehydrogenase-like predicted oxidoreductase
MTRMLGRTGEKLSAIGLADRKEALATLEKAIELGVNFIDTADIYAEKFVLPTCRELGIGFVPYSPLSRGLMTVTFPDPSVLEAGDSRRRLPRFNGKYLENNRRLVAEFAGIAVEKGCTPAQLALAWVLKQGDFIIPIPGTKQVRYLEENCGAVDVKLDAGDVAKIDALPGKYPNIGQRYDSGSLKLVNR